MEIPVIAGAYREIIRATPEGADHPWFTNDHTFIRGENGLWHCYAINNPMMDDLGKLYREHPFLLHATSASISGTWTRIGFAIDESSNTLGGALRRSSGIAVPDDVRGHVGREARFGDSPKR